MQQRCTKADHKNQPLIGVCLDHYCSSQRPYCNQCIPQHINHCEKLTSFELLHEWYSIRANSLKEYQNFIQKCKKVIDSINQFIIPIQNITLEEIQGSSLSKVDQIIKNLIQLEKIEIVSLSKMNSLIQTFDKIGENLIKLKNQKHQQPIDISIESNQKDDINLLQSQDEQFFSRLKWNNNPIIENQAQLIDKHSENINSIKNNQEEEQNNENIVFKNKIEVFSNQQQYQWQYSQLERITSLESSPKTVQIQKQALDNQLEQTSFINFQFFKQKNKIKVRFTNLQNNPNLLVSQEEKILKFSPYSIEFYDYLDSQIIPIFGIHKFAFKILSIGKTIHIGVADNKIFKKEDYQPNLEDIRHGTYLISNTGQTYSHILQENNQNNNQIHFFSNDIIIIEINMDNTTITWTKLSSNEQLTMKFQQCQSLSPFVRLSSQNPFHSVIEVYEDF
ncbi:unnamed protein product [Paramecium sonneborni]|uniref:Uncharacterized protein n=1 Tax=Paramecium sonneborni TaxID=65129 RepID=A0A8S1QZ19_9CILI|nr:unnamed protein product [Paramecium sonneborni]